MASQKLTVCTIQQSPGFEWENVIKKILNGNSDLQQCIFTEESSAYLSGYYVTKLTHRQLQYNIAENRFESVVVEKQHILKFDIYTDTNTMMLWGNGKLANLFMTMISQSTKNALRVDYCRTDYSVMLNRILKESDIEFSRMKIRDVVIEDGLLANCVVNLSNTECPARLVKKYKDKISQITVHLKSGEEVTSIMIYATGAVVVFKDREGISGETLDKIGRIVGGTVENGRECI